MTPAEPAHPIPFGRRIRDLAHAHPDETGLVYVDQSGRESAFAWRHIDERSTQVARWLATRGLREGQLIAVGLPNSPEHVFVTLAAWKLGVCVLPIRADLPAWERDRLLAVACPAVIIADWADCFPAALARAELVEADAFPSHPLPDRVAERAIAIPTGGSTGTPKLVLMPGRGEVMPGQALQPLARWMGLAAPMTTLVCGPLYHGNPFFMTYLGLMEGFRIVLTERFAAGQWVDLVERHGVGFCTLVPTMMKRIAELADVDQRNLSSLRAILHTAAPCPPWVKEAWIRLLGGERVYEAFGSAETVGFIVIRGDEWLEHRGSIGRPLLTEVVILDEGGTPVPPGVVGEVYMRLEGTTGPRSAYLGSDPARRTPDGFVSVGDLASVDEQGWYYSADRRQDLIISGGANIYPAEVEAALSEHPGIRGVVVIGVSDPEWGRRVHAIIEPADPAEPPTDTELDAHCRARLAAYKLPRSYERVDRLPRTEMDKIRRSELVLERGHEPPDHDSSQ